MKYIHILYDIMNNSKWTNHLHNTEYRAGDCVNKSKVKVNLNIPDVVRVTF